MKPHLKNEEKLWGEGVELVFGIDEAGRGCLAGPVCAAVLAWPSAGDRKKIPIGIKDSKLLSSEVREEKFSEITASDCVYGIGFASPGEIDTWNILRASFLASLRALELALAKI